MVESYGKEGYKYNAIDANDFNAGGGGDSYQPAGKAKRGGVGGRATKSNNYKEAKKANIRRNEKREREEAAAEAKAKKQWMEEETKKW